jgi:hypothetical protein
MKLGLRGHKEDRLGRTLQLRDFLVPGVAVPAACDLEVDAGLPHDGHPLGNDRVGNCGIAGPAHFGRWEDKILGLPETIGEEQALAEYTALTGWDPNVPDSDIGVYAIDVMKWWRTRGLFGRLIEMFAQVDFRDPEEMARAIFLLGGVFVCLGLPNAAFGADTWDTWADDGGPGGGHLVWYSGTELVNSWGQKIRVAPAFLSRYCFDAYAVVSAHSLRGGRAWSGLNLQQMREALAVITQ